MQLDSSASEIITGSISFNAELLFWNDKKPFTLKPSYDFSIEMQPGASSTLSLFLGGDRNLLRKLNSWLLKPEMKFGDLIENIFPDDPSFKGFINLDIAILTKFGFSLSDRQDITIGLNGVIISKPQREQHDSIFSLSTNSHHLIERGYSINDFEFSSRNEFSWIPKLNKSFPIVFGDVTFTLEHNFTLPEGSRGPEVIIKKHPVLRITGKGLDTEIHCKHARAICTLLSLFLNDNIDFNYSKVSGLNTSDFLYWSKSNLPQIEKKRGNFSHLFHYDWINWIQNFDTHKAVQEEAFLRHIVPRFNLAMASKGETRFMLLYNVLELIRNKTIDSLKENTRSSNRLRLVQGKEKVERKIKHQLKALQNLIAQEDKEIFLSSLDGKAAQILYIPMNSQFDDFMKTLGLTADNYGVNFKELISLRNEIFHGALTSIQSHEVSEINKLARFPTLVFCCLLRFFGFKNVPQFAS